MKPFGLICMLILALSPMRAKAAPSAPTPSEPPAPRQAPSSELTRLLADRLAGQPVIAVGSGFRDPRAGLSPTSFDRATSLLDKLQVMAEAASSGPNTLIPFRVGNAYVLAPETREDVYPDLKNLGWMDAMSEGALLDCVITSLTEGQVAALGSTDGLSVADLSADAQAAIGYVLQPPLRVPGHGVVEGPVDWRQARLRATFAVEGAMVTTAWRKTALGEEEERTLIATGRLPDAGVRPLRVPKHTGPVSIPVLQAVPNRFRKSDLDTRSYVQPVGISGCVDVASVLDRVAAVTGLHLAAAWYYRSGSAFVGSPTLTCGEVLDGLRLAVTGTYRKVGNTYLLGWDQTGLGSWQQYVAENFDDDPVTERAWSRNSEAQYSPAWLALIRDLPCDPADPLALTSEQRKHLIDVPVIDMMALAQPTRDPREFFARRRKAEEDKEGRIPFSEMTPSQQQYLMGVVASQEAGQASGARPQVTPEMLPQAYFRNSGRVCLSLLLPGIGWARLENMVSGYISGDRLQIIKKGGAALRRTRARKKLSGPDAAQGGPVVKPAPRPISAKTRGFLVPDLGEAHIAELAREMKRHGLNLLVYPALYDGYSSLPGTSFPLAPSLRGKDALSFAVSAMKKQAIPVWAYVSVLGWRTDGESAHWLSKHPAWVDTDVLGRTRLDWVRTHPDWKLRGVSGTLTESDYVRAQEPEVVARLTQLLADLANVPDLRGVVFLDSHPKGRAGYGWRMGPTPLGYALADRRQSVAATGDDPVDMPADIASPNGPLWPSVFDALDVSPFDAPRQDPARTADERRDALVQDLCKEAKRLRKDWTVCTADDFAGSALEPPLLRRSKAPSPEKKPPAKLKPVQDLNFHLANSVSDGDLAEALLVPLAPLEETKVRPPDADLPPILRANNGTGIALSKRSPTQIIVFDFRLMPDNVIDALRWISPPQADHMTSAGVITRPRDRVPGR